MYVVAVVDRGAPQDLYPEPPGSIRHCGSMAFSSLREYAPGDDPRQIHWRTTARLGRLVVREHVDTNEPTFPGPGCGAGPLWAIKVSHQ